MSEEYNEEKENIIDIQVNLDEETEMVDGASDTCAICKHPASKELIKIYLENKKSVNSAKTWFYNKFKKTYNERTWERHFSEHVDPFIDSYNLVRQKKLDELIKKSSDLKKDSYYNPTSVIKQIVIEMLLDGYAYKPKQLYTKEEQYNYNQLVKSITALAKVYQQYHQMDLDTLGFGKTEEEQIEFVKDFMTKNLKDVFSILESSDNIEDAKKNITKMFNMSIGG